MRKRNVKQREFQTANHKILTAQFARRLTFNFAAGDDANNLMIYNMNEEKPLVALNSQTSNVSSITALTFSGNEDQVVVGSSRGSINVWDLNTLKIAYCLKGHTVQVSSFAVDSGNDNILVSGSYDTQVKIWDTRLKNCLHILKHHSMRVEALAVSPDSRYILSGSQDGTIQFYDMKMFRSVNQYVVDANIEHLTFHPQSMIFAAGCADRMARIYQLSAPFSLLSTTKNQSMPVVRTFFHEKNFMFTAASQSLKVWDIKKGCLLTDHIEGGAKGVLDLIVAEQQSQQVGFSNGVLSLHICKLSQVSFKGQYTHTYTPLVNQSEERITKQSGTRPVRDQSIRKPVIQQLTDSTVKGLIQRRSDSVNKAMVDGLKQDVNTAISNVMRLTNQFARNKQETVELGVMLQEHQKFTNILTVRAKTIEKVLDLWSMGNTKAIISLLKEQVKKFSKSLTTEIYVVADVLNHILKPSKFPISIDFGLVIVENSREMMIAKHMTLIKHGLCFLNQIVAMFKEDILKIKLYPVDKGGVDLAREERVRKYDKLLELLMDIYQHPRLKKLLGKKQELCKLAESLHSELGGLFKKIYNNQDNF